MKLLFSSVICFLISATAIAMGPRPPGLEGGRKAFEDSATLVVIKDFKVEEKSFHRGERIPVRIKLYESYTSSKGELDYRSGIKLGFENRGQITLGSENVKTSRDNREDSAPQISVNTESCSITDRARTCSRDVKTNIENCSDSTITRSGIRTVENTSVNHSESYSIRILMSGSVVAKIDDSRYWTTQSDKILVPCH